MVKTTLVALAVVASASSLVLAEQNSKMGADDEKAIRKLVATNEAGWNSHNIEMLDSIFSDDAEFINVVGMHWRGKAAISKAHAVYHETMFKDCKIRTDDLSIRSIGPNHAIGVWVTTIDAVTTPGGTVIPKHQNRMTLVFAKDAKAGWQVVQAQNTPIDAQAAQFDPVKQK